MNKWRCEELGCNVTAVGVGGAIGLLAIGWTFRPGDRLLCPVHGEAAAPCLTGDGGPACRPCGANERADRLQVLIGAAVDERTTVATIVEIGRYWPTRRSE